MANKPCEICGANSYSGRCFRHKERKPLARIKRPRQNGKEYERWRKFRQEVAIPYMDEHYGHHCRCCGRSDVPLDIDHIHGKGARPELKYQLSNLQYLCRPCHRNKTDHLECSHSV